MEFFLSRRWYSATSILGVLSDGQPDCYTLERPAVVIAAGRFPLVLTVSGRAAAGTLWSPRADHKLPELLGVPNRTAIRIHALNHPHETEGCIGVGLGRGTDEIMESRLALIRVMAQIEAAGECWITIVDEPEKA